MEGTQSAVSGTSPAPLGEGKQTSPRPCAQTEMAAGQSTEEARLHLAGLASSSGTAREAPGTGSISQTLFFRNRTFVQMDKVLAVYLGFAAATCEYRSDTRGYMLWFPVKVYFLSF